MNSHPTIWILAIALLLSVTNGLNEAEVCLPAKCKLPKCKCSTIDSGSSIPVSKIPQIIMSSFDDAVTPVTYELFSKSVFNRTNPDGCPIGVTHFLSHEYTDYSMVHDLWTRGHEIALHSVTYVTWATTTSIHFFHRTVKKKYGRHDAVIEDYWKNITLGIVKSEFGDMRTMASHFAGIPASDIQGMRLPFLQTSGDVSFQGLKELGLMYDSSLPTQRYVDPPLWPYTLDYASHQDCAIDPCPTSSFPNVWEVPMVMWFDDKNIPCSMVDACVNIPKDAPSITKWIIKQFERHYKGNRAPFPIFMHAAWFLRNPENFKAYASFIEYAQTLPDVYIVSVNKTIEWMKNPKPVDVADKKPFGNCSVHIPPAGCKPLACGLKTSTGEDRWMVSCVESCPDIYPWLGNPLGV